MPFNGSGVYQPPGTVFPAIAGTLIEAEKFNTIINDIAGALSLCLPRDGQSAFLGNISAGGYMLTNLGVPTVVGHALVYGRPGDGTQLSLNASNLSSGTVPPSRVTGAYTGITAIASVLSQAELGLSANSGTFRLFRTYTNGLPRWSLGTDTSAESGSNAGSDFQLYRYDDSGNYLDSVLRVIRQTGQVIIGTPGSGAHQINGDVVFNGAIIGNGSSLTNLNANNLSAGTIPDGRFPAVLPAVSGANLTNLNASNLSSGAVPTARLGSGTANSSAFLRGDQQWTNALFGNMQLGPVAHPHYRAEHTDGARFFAGADNNSAFVGGETSNAILSLYSEGLVRLLFAPGGRADFQKSVRTEPASVVFSSTPTFDARESNVFYFETLTGNVTSMTIINPANGQTIQIRFVQDGTGGRTVALPSGALVSGSINTAPNSVTWLVITYVSTAARWEGTWTKVN